MKKIYYILQGEIHNIKDSGYQLIDEDSAYIGKYEDEGFRVDEEVCLWTLKDAIEFFKLNKK